MSQLRRARIEWLQLLQRAGSVALISLILTTTTTAFSARLVPERPFEDGEWRQVASATVKGRHLDLALAPWWWIEDEAPSEQGLESATLSARSPMPFGPLDEWIGHLYLMAKIGSAAFHLEGSSRHDPTISRQVESYETQLLGPDWRGQVIARGWTEIAGMPAYYLEFVRTAQGLDRERRYLLLNPDQGIELRLFARRPEAWSTNIFDAEAMLERLRVTDTKQQAMGRSPVRQSDPRPH